LFSVESVKGIEDQYESVKELEEELLDEEEEEDSESDDEDEEDEDSEEDKPVHPKEQYLRDQEDSSEGIPRGQWVVNQNCRGKSDQERN
jgi:hypothetical protein